MFAKKNNDADLSSSSKKTKRAAQAQGTQFQHAIGNQAFGRLLNRSTKSSQEKLRVVPSDDRSEHEADRVADRLSQSAEGVRPAGKTRRAARATSSGAKGEMDPGADFAARLKTTTGSPLPDNTRVSMEQSLGADFSGVRVHSGNDAARLNRSINSLAFTRGSNIYLGEGRNDLNSKEGKYLLAHELTHVMQQSNSPRAGLAHANPGLVQRFESDEHQHLGDIAAPGALYDLGGPNDKFELTHGDILALSGDVFPPDELFRLAAIPGNKGQKVGSRDEILWALQDTRIWELRSGSSGPYAGKKDPRFEPGGPYAGYVYSDAVKQTVFDRYRKLGADNAGHFVAPQGRDPSGAPLPAPSTAGTTYRTMHETAIKAADGVGRAGGNIGVAMAREAAAQHFLTDEFSAGHLRTPIGSIREYWGNKYPLFWYNLRHKIALDTAIELSSFTSRAYTTVLASVEALVPTLPAVTLGDLLASVFHDVDNERGVSTSTGGKVMGDKNLDAPTEKAAVAAIQAGNRDIKIAYDLGKQNPTPVPDVDLFGQIRLRNGGTADKYSAELQVPEPGKSEPPQNWKAPDINVLWDQKMLGTSGDTVGQEISRRVKVGAIAVQLNSLGDSFPVSGDWGTHPRAAYLKGFVAKLQADPKAGVLDIINWAPHGMNTGNTAEAARESVADLDRKGKAGDKKENLSNMTLQQRINYVDVLMANKSDFDQDTIITIFSNTTVADRPELYKGIEGHPWTGDFKRSKGDLDKLYAVTSGTSARVDRLKNLINGK